jgi:hypothetical protein
MEKLILSPLRRNKIYTHAQVEALSAKAQKEVGQQNKECIRRRRAIEDRAMARELGLTLAEVQTPH